MKNKVLFWNISLSGEQLSCGQPLAAKDGAAALCVEDAAERPAVERAEKVAKAGIALGIARRMGWRKARELCVNGDGALSLDGLRLPEERDALGAVWFYLALCERENSPEQAVALHNTFLARMDERAAAAALEKELGAARTDAFLRAVRATRTRQDDVEDPENVSALCAGADCAAVLDALMRGWES